MSFLPMVVVVAEAAERQVSVALVKPQGGPAVLEAVVTTSSTEAVVTTSSLPMGSAAQRVGGHGWHASRVE